MERHLKLRHVEMLSLAGATAVVERRGQVVLATARIMLLAAVAGSFWRPRATTPSGRSDLAVAD